MTDDETWSASRRISLMTRLKHLVVLIVFAVFSLGSSSIGFGQDLTSTLSLNSSQVSSPQDKLHALESTRFHFITLKQFHSALFSQKKQSNKISEYEAYVLNMALNKFLTSAGRETLLLEAMRRNKAVRLKFSLPEKTDQYEMIDHPTKPLVYRFEPLVKSTPASVEIKPLFDQSKAFQITFSKGSERFMYYVDWSGNANRSAV